MANQNYMVISTGEKKSKTTLYVFFGICVFILFFFPFFGLNLRYQIGTSLRLIISGMGKFCLAFGALFLGVAIIGLFTRGRNWPKYLVLGLVLLWIGAWCTGVIVEFFGITIAGPNKTDGSGYH